MTLLTDTVNVQRWIYRVDPKRVNEYGQVGEDKDTAQSLQEKKKQ